MRSARGLIAVFLMAGCQPGPQAEPASSVKSDADLPDPAAFASWPKVTNKPVHVGPALWALCRQPSPEEAESREQQAAPHGPHTGSIVVRVSPEAIKPFRTGETLPVGSSVIKEKHKDGLETMDEYAAMVKREAGYDPAGGDWEYAYVTLAPERKVTRGRLTECSGCHASKKQGDYLFRSYGEQLADSEPAPDFIAYLKRGGIVLEKATGSSSQWRIAGRPAGQHYEVVVDLKNFPSRMTASQMEAELMTINLAFQLNAPARLAMSFPGVQGLPGDDRKEMPDPDTLPACKELQRLFNSYRGP